MLDIDNFKDFNDEHGHIAGDAILKNIGKILRAKAPAGDMVGRYGGEEFTLLALNCSKKDAIKLANDIREEIKKYHAPLIEKPQAIALNKIDITDDGDKEEAKEILASRKGGEKKITAIASDVGFNSMTAFYRVFKKYTGMTPNRYKEEVRKKK